MRRRGRNSWWLFTCWAPPVHYSVSLGHTMEETISATSQIAGHRGNRLNMHMQFLFCSFPRVFLQNTKFKRIEWSSWILYFFCLSFQPLLLCISSTPYLGLIYWCGILMPVNTWPNFLVHWICCSLKTNMQRGELLNLTKYMLMEMSIASVVCNRSFHL